jgi:hypothetical protein
LLPRMHRRRDDPDVEYLADRAYGRDDANMRNAMIYMGFCEVPDLVARAYTCAHQQERATRLHSLLLLMLDGFGDRVHDPLSGVSVFFVVLV